MSEKEVLQKAADEARKAARAARELGSSLDDYAKYLTQPGWQQRADDLRLSASNKLSVIHDGLAACDRWMEEGRESAFAPPPPQPADEREDLREQDINAAGKTKNVRVVRKAARDEAINKKGEKR